MSIAIDNLAINVENQQFVTIHESPYVGPPAEDIDQAWQALLANINLRVTKEELDRHDQKSVQLPGGGHLAWLGVFHQLHCTVSIYIPSLDTPLKLSIEDAPQTQLQRGLLPQHDDPSSARLAGARRPLYRVPASFGHVPSGHDVVDDL